MIFVDTSAWFALLAERDAHHRELRGLFSRIASGEFGAPLTTDFVLDEAFTLLRMRWGMTLVRQLADLLARSPTVRRVQVGETEFDAALVMMLAHSDKRWSLTDCTSFVMMHEAGVSRAATLDHNFAEAGFTVVP